MRKIQQVLRLHFVARSSIRAIARSINASPSTVGDYIRRAQVAGLSWPLPEGMSESALERQLFPPAKPTHAERPLPDWPTVHRELRRKHVTLALLWQEYKAEHPDGLQYSWFCQQYREWAGKLDLVMRQSHRAGEKLFVDYAGDTVPIIDRHTGELSQAQIFVAVMGASNFTYAEATATQSLPDWCAAHVRALRYFGGVPQIFVPDNATTAVTRAHRFDPELNATYHDLACHYDAVIIPARVRKPRDKAKVEGGVLLVERWILAALRNRQFFSLSQLNDAIAELLQRLNDRAFKKLPGSRRSLFESLDRPAMQSLPTEPYVFAQWKKVRVHIDCHIELQRHYYSAPHQLVGKQLMARFSAATVELFHRGERVASHQRSHIKGAASTVEEHLPEAHRRFAQKWSPQRFIRWAASFGPATEQLITDILNRRRHPEQSYRACMGILRLGKTYSDVRLERACARALTLGTTSVRSIESILKHRLDEQPELIDDDTASDLPHDHDNIRGPSYYH
jgi:transposase